MIQGYVHGMLSWRELRRRSHPVCIIMPRDVVETERVLACLEKNEYMLAWPK